MRCSSLWRLWGSATCKARLHAKHAQLQGCSTHPPSLQSPTPSSCRSQQAPPRARLQLLWRHQRGLSVRRGTRRCRLAAQCRTWRRTGCMPRPAPPKSNVKTTSCDNPPAAPSWMPCIASAAASAAAASAGPNRAARPDEAPPLLPEALAGSKNSTCCCGWGGMTKGVLRSVRFNAAWSNLSAAHAEQHWRNWSMDAHQLRPHSRTPTRRSTLRCQPPSPAAWCGRCAVVAPPAPVPPSCRRPAGGLGQRHMSVLAHAAQVKATVRHRLCCRWRAPTRRVPLNQPASFNPCVGKAASTPTGAPWRWPSRQRPPRAQPARWPP